jgi:transcriptional regulator with XRE-family HTH domain
MRKIREKIIELRKSKNISQKTIADYLNISQAAYYKIESGKTQLAVWHLVKIAALLDVCPGDLINQGLGDKTY